MPTVSISRLPKIYPNCNFLLEKYHLATLVAKSRRETSGLEPAAGFGIPETPSIFFAT
jgi:hypothetical protein